MKKSAYISTLRRLLGYIRPYGFFLAVSILAALFSVLATLFFPLLTGRAIDSIASSDTASFFRYIAYMAASAGIAALFQFVMNISNNKLAYSVSRDIRKDAFLSMKKLPLSYIDSHPHGDIVARMVADADQISDGLLMGFTQLFTGIITIFGTLICMFAVNWRVALVVLFVTPLSLLSASFIAKRTFSLFYKQNSARGEQTAFIDEMVTSMDVVSAFGMEKDNQKRFDEINGRWAGASLLAVFYSSLTNPVTRFVNSIVYAGVALSGAFSCFAALMTIGELSSILSYASQYTKPFNEISGVMTEFQNAMASADRVFRFLDEKKESDDSALADLRPADGAVSFDHVRFSYNPGNPIIRDISLKAEPGMRIAIVGPTGCGKTTLINLLMRFYDPDSGTISIDGQNTLDVNRASLRRHFGMVLQDTWIMTGTVRENISFGSDVDDAKIEEAARICHIDGYISSLPGGYDEVISDDSGNISAGQKQLMSIARVMLSEPEMLILDEATSSIDTRTEMLIQEAFSHLMEGRTSFIVAHRLSTIRNADLIIVMKDGEIIESGKHQELLDQNGFYSNLYRSQFA